MVIKGRVRYEVAGRMDELAKKLGEGREMEEGTKEGRVVLKAGRAGRRAGLLCLTKKTGRVLAVCVGGSSVNSLAHQSDSRMTSTAPPPHPRTSPSGGPIISDSLLIIGCPY